MLSSSQHDLIVRDVNPDGFVRVSNELALRIGFTVEELAERSLEDWLHPEDRAAFASALRRPGGEATARHAARSGDWLPIAWRVRTEGECQFAVGALQLAPSLEAPPVPRDSAGRSSMGRMLDDMARIVEARNPGMRCSILLVDPESKRVRVGAGPSLPQAYNAAVEGLRIGPTVGSCGTASYWNLPVVVEDIARDPLWRNLRDAASIAGVAACWSQPIRSTDGSVLGAMALYDVVPRRPEQHQMNGLAIAAHMVGLAIERETLAAQLQQAAKMEALGVMAGGVAHDFNNLLAVIAGNVELVQAKTSEPDLQTMLKDVATATRNAAGLCNQMLAFAGRATIAIEAVDCGEMIRDLVTLLQVSLSKKAKLHLDLADDLYVTADPSQLRQVLFNVIANGAEAIGNHEGALSVTTRRASSPAFDGTAGVELVITDTGCGMPPEVRQRIFDPFYSTKADGRGLGLAAVKGIVDSHGWRLDVHTAPGAGTTFTLTMTAASRPPATPPTPTSSPAARPPAERSLVLVVDDEPAVRRVISRMVERLGMQVLQAADGAEAIDLFRARGAEIGCVLLDLNMPRLDGEEVFRAIRKMRPDARVLLMSGYAEQETVARFHGLGVAGVLQKPVSSATLQQKLGPATAAAR